MSVHVNTQPRTPHPTGKVKRSVDKNGHPEDTAARELEEETHGLIPAADSSAVLPYCPVMYSPDAKMVVYFMRYIGAEQLPSLMEQRLAGKDPGVLTVEATQVFAHSQPGLGSRVDLAGTDLGVYP
jgi:hypothetical protein